MKKILFLAILLCGLQQISAQYMGIKGGFNYATLQGDVASGASVSGTSAFYGGLTLEIPFSKLFSIQGEALFNRVGAKIQSPTLGSSTLHLNYLSLPAMARFNITKAINVHLGPQLSFLLDSPDFTFENTKSTTVDPKSIDRFDVSLLIGAGFTSYSGWFLEARLAHGISNIFESHPTLSDAKISKNYSLKNSVISVGIGYVF